MLNIHVPKKAVKHNYTNLDFFQNIDTEEKAYWLGFIYADGCIMNSGYTFTISINKKDEEHLQKLSDIFNKPLRSFTQTCSLMNNTNVCEMVKLYIYNKSMYNDLLKCGVEERKTYSDTTQILESIPEKLIHHFIRGYFDGDGTITCQSNNMRIAYFNLIGIKDFLIQVQNILNKNVLSSNVVTIRPNKNIYTLTYNKHKNMREFYDWIYYDSTIYLNRKKIRFEQILDVIEYIPIEWKDRNSPPYRGAVKQKGNTWASQTNIFGKYKYLKNCNAALEAAYWHDLEQVKQRGENSLKYMNFPSKYNDFVQWIKEGY